MTARLVITPVEPIGTKVVDDVLHGRQHVVPAYPPKPPEATRLRDLRVSLGLGIRDAAAAYAVAAVEAGGLERGRHVCDWSEAERRLREYAAKAGR